MSTEGKTRWSYEEVDKLAPAAALELAKSGCLLYEAVNRAQKEVLPADRYRELTQNQHVIKNTRLFNAIQDAQEILGTQKGAGRSKRGSAQKTKYSNGWIRWTSEEEGKVAEVAGKLMRDNWSMLQALRQAQEEALPATRRKNILTIGQIQPHLAKQIEVKRHTLPEAPEVPEETPPAAEQEQAAPINWVAKPLPEAKFETVDQGLQMILQRLDKLDRISDRLESVEYILMQVLEAFDKEGRTDISEVATQTIPLLRKATKRKVLILGLLSEQFQTVGETWGDFFKLSYVESGHGAGTASYEAMKGADYVIGLVRFMSHSEEGRAKSAAKSRYFRANTVNEVMQLLEGFFQRDNVAGKALDRSVAMRH